MQPYGFKSPDTKGPVSTGSPLSVKKKETATTNWKEPDIGDLPEKPSHTKADFKSNIKKITEENNIQNFPPVLKQLVSDSKGLRAPHIKQAIGMDAKPPMNTEREQVVAALIVRAFQSNRGN